MYNNRLDPEYFKLLSFTQRSVIGTPIYLSNINPYKPLVYYTEFREPFNYSPSIGPKNFNSYHLHINVINTLFQLSDIELFNFIEKIVNLQHISDSEPRLTLFFSKSSWDMTTGSQTPVFYTTPALFQNSNWTTIFRTPVLYFDNLISIFQILIRLDHNISTLVLYTIFLFSIHHSSFPKLNLLTLQLLNHHYYFQTFLSHNPLRILRIRNFEFNHQIDHTDQILLCRVVSET